MSGARQPISSHPGFRVGLALWFAALLGLAAFVLPAALYERASVGLGLAELLPAAAPPLGEGARIAISLLAAALGLALGLFVAGRIARRNPDHADEEEVAPPVMADLAGEPAPREPLRIREELSEDRLEHAIEGEEHHRPAPLEADPDDDLARFAADRMVAGLAQSGRSALDESDESEPGSVNAAREGFGRELSQLALPALLARFEAALELYLDRRIAMRDEAEENGEELAGPTVASAPETLSPDPRTELRSALEKLARTGPKG